MSGSMALITTPGAQRMVDRGWSRLFDEPMQDGGEHVAAVPKNVHDAPEWPLATEAMILMSEQGYVRPD